MEAARKPHCFTNEAASLDRQSGTSAADGRKVDAALVRGPEIELIVDGHPLRAFLGESVAAALLAAGKRALRTTSRTGEPRGLYCGIGVCFECVMTVDGRPNVRTCQTPVREGLQVETRKETTQCRTEVFTEGCASCEGAIAYAHELASSSADYEMRVWDVTRADGSARMHELGVAEVPALAIDDELLACCAGREGRTDA